MTDGENNTTCAARPSTRGPCCYAEREASRRRRMPSAFRENSSSASRSICISGRHPPRVMAARRASSGACPFAHAGHSYGARHRLVGGRVTAILRMSPYRATKHLLGPRKARRRAIGLRREAAASNSPNSAALCGSIEACD